MNPVVGQQVTIRKNTIKQTRARLALLMARADVGECDLIAKQTYGKREQGYLYANGLMKTDSVNQPAVTSAKLLLSVKNSITFTCTPPGSGYRMGIDRNEDGILDGDIKNKRFAHNKH